MKLVTHVCKVCRGTFWRILVCKRTYDRHRLRRTLLPLWIYNLEYIDLLVVHVEILGRRGFRQPGLCGLRCYLDPARLWSLPCLRLRIRPQPAEEEH